MIIGQGQGAGRERPHLLGPETRPWSPRHLPLPVAARHRPQGNDHAITQRIGVTHSLPGALGIKEN